MFMSLTSYRRCFLSSASPSLKSSFGLRIKASTLVFIKKKKQNKLTKTQSVFRTLRPLGEVQWKCMQFVWGMTIKIRILTIHLLNANLSNRKPGRKYMSALHCILSVPVGKDNNRESPFRINIHFRYFWQL